MAETNVWEDKIYAYSLKNAIEHEGKAMAGSVLGHLFQDGLKKDDIKEVMPLINEDIKKVNSMGEKEREKEFKKFEKFVKIIEHKEREGLPELPDAQMGKVITRIAPEPSKYNHLGHALSFLFNYLYAKKYKGKCLLRFEDTNPEKVSQEYLDAMKEDLIDYLGIKVDGIRIVSEDMKLLYDYAKKLIEMDKAYMCFCSREKMQKLREEGKECPCREFDKKKNLDEWKKFLAGKYMKGEAVLRIKGDMKSVNYVMRDSVIFRAVEAQHYKYKDKYHVWPMYDFYNPIEDSIMGVTHILRSNEFEVRVELQDYIKELLELPKQTIVQYGRFNVIGTTTQGREIRELIDSGKYLGWDDPRLVTLRALKRRGIVKEAFYELAQQMGLTNHAVNLDFDMIAAINRKIIDPNCDRYSFAAEPVELKIENKPKIKEVEVKLHPEKEKKRKIKLGERIFISNKDYESNIGKELRLMNLYNLQLEKDGKAKFTSEHTKDNDKSLTKINWVSNFLNAKVMMPDATFVSGVVDDSIKKLKIDDEVQFERFGFVRLDKINDAGEYEFWFSHK